MSHPFLETFVASVVARLVAAELIELRPGCDEAVAVFVAHRLATARHASLVSELAKAMVAAPDVLELYADDEQLKAVIDDLDRRSAGF